MEPFADLLWLTHALISVGLRRRGGHFSVDLSLSVLLYNTKFMNKLNSMIFFLLKRKIFHWLYKLFSVYKITLLSTQRKVGPLRKWKSALLVYLYYYYFFLSIYIISL